MEWKVWVHTAESCHKVILPSANGFFGGIGAVEVWWDQLVVHALGVHEFFEAGRALVVKLLEDGFEAPIGEQGVELGVGSDKLMFATGLEGLGEDVVAVIVVDDHDVFVALT